VPQIVRKARLVKKEVEPIFSSEEAMKLAAKTEGELIALLIALWINSSV
jgi:hypothetical protein